MNDISHRDADAAPRDRSPEPLAITTFYPPQPEAVPLRLPQRVGRFRGFRSGSSSSNLKVAVALFLATCVSVFVAGMLPGAGLFELLGRANAGARFLPPTSKLLLDGGTYFGAVMLILVAHEMGHYLQARRYRVPASVPYFIPFPISPFGTMGAVIIQSAGVADRKSLFDIAISGPLAGLVFALPIAAIGITQADIVPTDVGTIYGDPLILKWLTYWMRGPLPPHTDLHLNACLFAGWVGIFITALNLMPISQLDGGHILYTLIGRKAHRVAIGLLGIAIALIVLTGQFSYGLMVLLLVIAGPRHPPTADDNVPLGMGRVVLGWLTLAFVIIGFTPVPITILQAPR
jgi:membrane-associated protease RseP (regulator of RpoE activity)